MTAAAITARALPYRTTMRGATGRGTTAREIRTAVSAPHGQQGGYAETLDESADEGGDQYGSGRGQEQDQAEVTDGSAEGGAHRRPRGADDAVGQPEDHEAAEGKHVEGPAHCAGGHGGSPALLSHWSM